MFIFIISILWCDQSENLRLKTKILKIHCDQMSTPINSCSWVGKKLFILWLLACFLRVMSIECRIVSCRYPGVADFPIQYFIFHETDLTPRKDFSFIRGEVLFLSSTCIFGLRVNHLILTAW